MRVGARHADGDRARRHPEPDVVPSAAAEHERAADDGRGPVEVGSVDGEHAEGDRPDDDSLPSAVGVDEPQADLGSGGTAVLHTPARPLSVGVDPNRCRTTVSSSTFGPVSSRGSMTKAP